MTDLDQLFAPPVSVDIGGQAIEIRELTVGKLAEFLRAAAPIMALFEQGASVQTLMSEAGAVVESVHVATGIDRGRLNGMPAKALLKLLEGVIEANADFFAAALPAFIATLVEKAAKLRAGLTPFTT
jgi:hypothetical protein